jgi:Rod binding domain-containing protein
MSTLANVSLGASSIALNTQVDKNDPQKIAGAAKQFEALLIAEMLKSVHESGGGWMGTGDDQTASPAMEMGDEQFAMAIASKGGLGLGTMIKNALTPKSAAPVQND